MKKNFQPPWRQTPPESGTYRSIFKWGDPGQFKHPNQRLYAMLKDVFGLDDTAFVKPGDQGDEVVRLKQKSAMAVKHVKKFESICGRENVMLDDYSRLKYSTGKTMEEAIQLRKEKKIDAVTGAVLHPRNKIEIAAIVAYCHANRIPVQVYGGGSSVTLGLNAPKGGVTLVMQTYMKRLISIDDVDQTVRVEAGMMGPELEELLNEAPERLGAKRRYTCGHFPQSFEYSSVGGWIVTLGSGQQSSYYGDAGDLVLGVEAVTPTGTVITKEFAAAAIGPSILDFFKGSEGAFGVITELTLKIFRFMPENRRPFAFMFPNWRDAVNASREISQSEFGMPSVFRISDEEETDVAMKLYGIEGTPINTMLKLRGFRPMERCLLIGQSDGHKDFTAAVVKNVKQIARAHGGMWLTGYPVKQWEHGRYRDPYMREDLHDFGIVIDTLETTVSWSKLHTVHQRTRAYIKKRKEMVCMTHASHFYAQGTNLYFIFIGRYKNLKDYKKFQEGIIDIIEKSGGSLSHHHGIGRMIAPWLPRHLGKEQMGLLRAIKKYIDPRNIMNPGSTLALDLSKGREKK